MYIEEYGNDNMPAVVMLHGAFFADSFGKQYSLADNYHLIIPHIKGFGRAANEIFTADEAIGELKEAIRKYAPVKLVGFSLGAQLAFRLVSEYPELFESAVIVSPWLMNKDNIPDKIIKGNLKMLSILKNRFICRIISLATKMPKDKANELTVSMKTISEKSVINCVDNKISFETQPEYANIKLPILAMAGSKESDDILNSVKTMERLNKNCKCEIIDKAKHNIPTAFSIPFNQRLIDFFGNT